MSAGASALEPMEPNRNSRVVTSERTGSAEGGVRGGPTRAAIEAPRLRGTRATVRPARVLPALAALALVAACHPHLEGNGQLAEQDRTVDAFTGVWVSDGVAAHVTIGSPQSVRVFADSNLVQSIETEVDPLVVGTHLSPDVGTTPVLRVWVSGQVDPTIPPSVVVTVPSLSFVRAQDGSTADVVGLASPGLRVEAASNGEVSVAGPGGDHLDVALTDGSADASAYPVGTAQVSLSGASRAELDAGLVTGTASGTSIVANLVGSGPCYVTTTGSARVTCHP